MLLVIVKFVSDYFRHTLYSSFVLFFGVDLRGECQGGNNARRRRLRTPFDQININCHFVTASSHGAQLSKIYMLAIGGRSTRRIQKVLTVRLSCQALARKRTSKCCLWGVGGSCDSCDSWWFFNSFLCVFAAQKQLLLLGEHHNCVLQSK